MRLDRVRIGDLVMDLRAGRLLRDGQELSVTPLEMQLLETLVREPGRLFGRPELAELLWPDVAVTDDSLSQVVRRLRRSIGDGVIETVPRRGYRLAAPVEVPSGPARVVAPADAFVGRVAELADIRALLADGARVCTLVGPAAVGKTRIARELAAQADHRVVWADLVTARTEADVVRAVGAALGLQDGGTDPAATVGVTVAGLRSAMLVLDNVEQVADACRGLVDRWASDNAGVGFLLTGRRPVGARGEQPIAIGPLPPEDGVALFRTRSGSDAPDAEIAELVAALDGLPLAIELAAPRTRVMGVPELLASLQSRFAVLRSARPSDDRQASLLGTLEASWGLLQDAEREALVTLRAFVTPFRMQDARGVLGEVALDQVQALVDQSWLALREGRLAWLQTLREFVGVAAEATELERGEERHDAYLLELIAADEWLAADRDPDQPTPGWLFEAHPDLLEAGWRAVAAGQGSSAETFAIAVWRCMRILGPLTPAVELLEAAASTPMAPQRARLLSTLGEALRQSGRFPQALEATDAALALCRDGDPETLATARVDRAQSLRWLGRSGEAHEEATEALALLEQVPACFNLGICHTTLAAICSDVGDGDGSLHHNQEALALFRALGEWQGQAVALGNIGLELTARGRMPEALAAYQQALELYDQAGNRIGESRIRGSLAVHLAHAGHPEAAVEQMERALAVSQQVGQPQLEARHTSNLASLLTSLGRAPDARRLLERAIWLHHRLGARVSEGLARTMVARLDRLGGDLDMARASLVLAVDLLQGRGVPWAVALLERAEVDLTDGGAPSSVGEDLAVAFGVLNEARERRSEARAWCLKARYEARRGDLDGARTALELAEARVAELGAKPTSELASDLERARAEVG